MSASRYSRLALQVVLQYVEQIVRQAESAMALAVLLDLRKQPPQGVRRDTLFRCHLFLNVPQPICFFPVAHQNPLLPVYYSRDASAIVGLTGCLPKFLDKKKLILTD